MLRTEADRVILGEARPLPIRRLVCNFEQGATGKLRIRETEGGEERRRKIDEIDWGITDVPPGTSGPVMTRDICVHSA